MGMSDEYVTPTIVFCMQIRVVNETLTKMTSSGEQRNHQQTEFQSPDELLSGEEEMPDH